MSDFVESSKYYINLLIHIYILILIDRYHSYLCAAARAGARRLEAGGQSSPVFVQSEKIHLPTPPKAKKLLHSIFIFLIIIHFIILAGVTCWNYLLADSTLFIQAAL